MTKTTYYTATSLDGYIADERHSLEWLFRQDQDAEGGPLNYDDFFSTVGAIVMGSTTYEWILDHEDKVKEELGTDAAWPYELPTWVMSTRDLRRVEGDVRFAQGDVRPVHAAMADAAAGKDLWVVGGGDLAGQFAEAGLLDEIIVYIAAVTLGAGASLLPAKLDLRLEELARNKAFACARYSVVGTFQ